MPKHTFKERIKRIAFRAPGEALFNLKQSLTRRKKPTKVAIPRTPPGIRRGGALGTTVPAIAKGLKKRKQYLDSIE